jgi:hypothetical protein
LIFTENQNKFAAFQLLITVIFNLLEQVSIETRTSIQGHKITGLFRKRQKNAPLPIPKPVFHEKSGIK